MVRPAPNTANKKSKHRQPAKENRRTTEGSESSTGSTRFYSLNSLAQCGDMTQGQTSTPEVQVERPRESRSLECSPSSPRAASESSFVASTSIMQRQRSSSISSVQSSLQLPIIPSPPDSASNRSRCLAPLDINRGDTCTSADDIMAKMEAFFERQKEFNDRLEQRVAERLEAEKERENSRPRQCKRLPKELLVSLLQIRTKSHLSLKTYTIL